MEDKILLFEKSSYNTAKYVTYSTRSYPKNDGSGRWVVEYYDVYEDGTEILILIRNQPIDKKLRKCSVTKHNNCLHFDGELV